MSPRGNGWRDWPPRAKPRAVEDGIKAHTKRGDKFGKRWWAKRWIAVLESFPLGARLQRGRSYARAGQVVDIALESGGVRASVQGSRAEPYHVTIRMRELSAREWSAVGAAIAANSRLAAMLLAGEMPEDIETAFAAAGTTLFPSRESELKTACSCPDWSNPCKHVAAVFYLIGEEFDRDPFLLFAIRGLPRDAVRDLLTAPGSTEVTTTANPKVKAKKRTASRPPAPDGLPPAIVPQNFWGAAPPERLPAADDHPIVKPAVDGLLMRKAGRFPLWRAVEAPEEALAPVYARATEAALAWLAENVTKR